MSQGRKTNRGGNCEWYTPRSLLLQLEHEFGAFQLDPCALNREVAVAPEFYSPEQNGLYQPWAPRRVFLNPPYGDKVIGLWMDKAWTESRLGALVICLVPAYVGSGWWHDLVIGKADVRFIRGRIVFGRPDADKRGDAPFDSAIVIYRPVQQAVA